MKKTMIRWSALLSMALLMLPVSGCNKGRGGEGNPDQPDQPDQPEQIFTAMSEVGLVSDAGINPNSTRAEFIGEVGHKTHMPNLIKWGEPAVTHNADGTYTNFIENNALPVWVLMKNQAAANQEKLYLVDDYSGVLKFSYRDADVINGKVPYMAVTTRGKDKWLNNGAKDQECGAWITNFDHIGNAGKDFFLLWTQCVPDVDLSKGKINYKIGDKDWKPIDITNRSVAWPLISYPVDESHKPDPSKSWCEVDHKYSGTGKGLVNFNLFGNIVNIRIANNSGVEDYDVSYSTTTNGADVLKRPHLIIESNGMLFAPAKFRFDKAQNGGFDISTYSSVNKIKFRVDNLKFTKRGEEQNFPIWFRPTNPNGNFNLKVTWKIYSQADGKWYTETRTLKPSTTMDPVTGTPFDAFDGHYYTFDLAFNASYGLEFGTEKFVEIVNDVPAFD